VNKGWQGRGAFAGEKKAAVLLSKDVVEPGDGAAKEEATLIYQLCGRTEFLLLAGFLTALQERKLHEV
jgi:hypothetical protein